MRDIKSQIACRSTPRGSLRQSYRNFFKRHSGELRQKRTCWTDANMKEKFVTILLRATKNHGLRVNKQLVLVNCRQEKI